MAKDQVIVMGHKISDPDSFGACMGIYRAAVALEKKAHIVINDVSTSIKPLYDEIAQSSVYGKDIFLTSGGSAGLYFRQRYGRGGRYEQTTDDRVSGTFKEI